MAKNFYEMLLMKNLELLRAKSRIKELLDIESEKNGEINRQRSTIESLRREMKEQSEKRAN
jgi:C4-type Zn-finger protein